MAMGLSLVGLVLWMRHKRAGQRLREVVALIEAKAPEQLRGTVVGNLMRGVWRHREVVLIYQHDPSSEVDLFDVLTPCKIGEPFFLQGEHGPVPATKARELEACSSRLFERAGGAAAAVKTLCSDGRFLVLKTEPSARISNVVVLEADGDHQFTHLGMCFARPAQASARKPGVELDGAFLVEQLDLLVELSSQLRASAESRGPSLQEQAS